MGLRGLTGVVYLYVWYVCIFSCTAICVKCGVVYLYVWYVCMFSCTAICVKCGVVLFILFLKKYVVNVPIPLVLGENCNE